jgi:hypothetical protein
VLCLVDDLVLLEIVFTETMVHTDKPKSGRFKKWNNFKNHPNVLFLKAIKIGHVTDS